VVPFRVRGDIIEVFPAHYEDRAWRVSMFGDEVESIVEFDPLTGNKTANLEAVEVYCQFALCHAAPDAVAIDQGHQGRVENAPR